MRSRLLDALWAGRQARHPLDLDETGRPVLGVLHRPTDMTIGSARKQQEDALDAYIDATYPRHARQTAERAPDGPTLTDAVDRAVASPPDALTAAFLAQRAARMAAARAR